MGTGTVAIPTDAKTAKSFGTAAPAIFNKTAGRMQMPGIAPIIHTVNFSRAISIPRIYGPVVKVVNRAGRL